ncbi:hypothetical protein AKJ41_04750 [candidate division MSBL1 archaeon SCGC-AAA259O05]|uniref:PIN domain-containing protein n=1 Tax=candidate division MSBL1 archaeon SCGC-AAA259O05 TaxID=1698271 RepID=A0A133V099_9EURY|nr:hypothetical protein AKJ41_04750 [candidate division MSBL1 archaeon SCGC-AAA259O05]
MEDLKELPHDPLLVDTNVVLGRIDHFEALCSKSRIDERGAVPTVPDFIDREIRNARIERDEDILDRYRRVRDSRDGGHFLWQLVTPFRTVEQCKKSLDMMPRGAKHRTIQTYRKRGELDLGSRHKDFALIAVATLMADSEGLHPRVVSRDGAIRDACRNISELGYDLRCPALEQLLGDREEFEG